MAAVTAVPMISKMIPVIITNNNTVIESHKPNEDPDKKEIANEIPNDKALIRKALTRLVTNESPVIISLTLSRLCIQKKRPFQGRI